MKEKCNLGAGTTLNHNLLSVSQLNNLGCKVEFENMIAKIYATNGKMIGKGD